MKMEFTVEGRVIVIEAEGSFSVEVREVVVVPPVASIPVPVRTSAPALQVVPVPVVSDDDFFKPDVPASAPVDCELFRRLSALRRDLAVAAKVPPYVVFHDKTLRAMIECMPADLEALGAVPGVGASKLEKYGEAFLSVIKGA